MTRKLLLATLCLVVAASCASKKEKTADDQAYKLSTPLVKQAPYDEGYPLTSEDVDTSAPYKMEEYVKYYSEYDKGKIAPPPFDFNMDLSKKSFNELRMLRAEILARHGFLFMDYVLRSQFNATKWYKPVFWDDNFKIKLTDPESKFISKVLQEELAKYKKNYIQVDGHKMANLDNVVNWQQFDSIPKEMMSHLRRDGFVINKASYEQLFQVYDENYYDYTPSFITTDLFLQVLHMHLSKEMMSLEQDKMIPIVSSMLTEQLKQIAAIAKAAKDPAVKDAAEWDQAYYAIALSLLSGEKQPVPETYSVAFQNELGKLQEAQGRKSEFLGDSLFDYSQLQPRGNYTRTDSLKRYFKCIKWLNSAPIFLDEDRGLTRAIVLGSTMLKSDGSLKNYQTFSGIVEFLAGEENNISMTNLVAVLNHYKDLKLEDLLSKATMEKIRLELYGSNPRKFEPKGGNLTTVDFLARKKFLFTAGRYTFDGEILQRLTHITRPTPMRTFPKALDVFAVMGNKTAEDILLNVYQEGKSWPGYPDTLKLLKSKFQNFNSWNANIYNKSMEVTLSLQKTSSALPYFMQLPNWQKKNLNTMLATWTELKHDMILYIEQPSGAEMGDGGEIPPPQKIAYVEPQLEFWNKCLELLQLNSKMLSSNNVITKKVDYRNTELEKIAKFLNKISSKEMKGELVTNPEFDSLSFLGGQIESLTLNILESTEMTTSTVRTPDRYVAVATDVYTYNDKCLEEGVGLGDEIYVVADINGLLYLTRGAVFSHYEFIQPTSERLTDEEWQQQLLDNKEPPQAVWMNDIRIRIPHVKTAPNFNLY